MLPLIFCSVLAIIWVGVAAAYRTPTGGRAPLLPHVLIAAALVDAGWFSSG